MKTARKPYAPVPKREEPWVSIPQAATLLGVAYNTVPKMALRGLVKTRTIGGRVFISRESISAYLAAISGDESSES